MELFLCDTVLCLYADGECSPVGKNSPTVLAGCCKANGNEGTKEQIARISLSSSVVHLLEKEASQNSYLRFIKGQKKETVSCIFLRGNVLRRIMNALVVHCGGNEGNRPRLSIKKMG